MKKIVILFCLMFALSATKAQTSFQPEIWVQPNQPTSQPYSFIANYPVLDLEDLSIIEAFVSVAEHDHGTLFLVGDFPSTTNFITFGKIAISNTEAQAGQSTLTYDSLSGKPAILNLAYTISPKYKKPPLDFYIDPDIRLAEIMFFDHGLSDGVTRKVETYLALKYSINITANTEQELRHYMAPDDQKVWDFPVDVLYEEEVMGLGRSDAEGFYQTQTFSSDASSIRLSFSQRSQLGDMPELELADESHLILSKKTEVQAKVICGNASSQQLWKVHFHKWSTTNPPEAFLWFDTVFDLESAPILTNGLVATPMAYQELNGGTQITLPLKGLNHREDYYIVFQYAQNCDPLAQLEVLGCLAQPGSDNMIRLQVNDEGLDADIQLYNRTTGEQFVFELLQNNGEISPIPAGQYELLVLRNNQPLLNQVFQMGDCGDGSSAIAMGSPQLNQFGNPIADTRTDPGAAPGDKSIIAYPNPLQKRGKVEFYFDGFEPTTFDVQISDRNGRIIHTGIHALDGSEQVYTFYFQEPGVYNVSFTSSFYAEVKRIIVQ